MQFVLRGPPDFALQMVVAGKLRGIARLGTGLPMSWFDVGKSV